MSESKNKPSVNNIFYNEVPAIYIQKGSYTFNNLYEYNADSYKLRNRYFEMPNVDPKVDISFENANLQKPNIQKPHINVPNLGAGVAGHLTGDVLYDMAVNGTSDKVSVQNVTKQIYNAGVWEAIQSSSVYGAVYAFGAEAIVPVKIGWSVVEASSILKRELDYLSEHNILTKENIKKAEYNAMILAASGAFVSEIKFASKLGHASGIFTANATGSFLSRALKDSYNYEPHKPGLMESFFIFKTKYIEYPIVFVLGGTHEVIDFTIDWSANKIEGGYYWVKENLINKPSDISNDINNYLLEEFNAKYNIKSIEDIIREKIVNENLVDFNQILESSDKPSESIEDLKNTPVEKFKCELQDNSCSIDLKELSNPKSFGEKIINIANGSDTESIQSLVTNINNFNSVLEGANIIKNWKHMDSFNKEKNVIGFALKNFSASDMSSHDLSIIHSFGAIMMKDDITPEDFALFVASFPDTPLPIVDFLKFGFAAIHGDDKAVQQAFLGLTLNVLALSNPVFTVAQVIMTTIDLAKQLLTKVKVIEISGIEAKFTDKIRVRGVFKVYHKCSMDNDFFDIHVSTSAKHSKDAKADLEKKFNDQAFYKVYQVIGYPAKALDPNLVIEGRVNNMLWNKYLLTLYVNWLEVNKNYLTQEEYDNFKKKMFETEDDKEFKTWLNENGYDCSWFTEHYNENPVEFYKSVSKELEGCSLLEGVSKFFSLFKPKEGDTVKNKDDDKTTQTYINVRNKRSKNDNNKLDDFNDKETDDYNNEQGRYSKMGLFKDTNREILERHISVGYIFDTASSTVFNNVGSTIAYIDQECIMIYQKPVNYVCYKSEQLASSFANNYITNSITEHLMTIPTILIEESIITDDMLKYIAPSLNIGVGLGVNAIYGALRGKPSEQILNDTLNAGLNGSLTTGAMSLAKNTVLMTSLDGVSKKFSTLLLVKFGLVIPQAALVTIVTSATLCIIQRTAVVVYNQLAYPDMKKVKYINNATMIRTNDIMLDLRSDDLFFHIKNDDEFFATNNNFGNELVQPCF